ncbi:MAG: UDP-N-acetylglucosamine 1-carboxyvinyltransferase [Armatimonadetes bacterium]|nr:UDP-N-acetylglucosamine 1-carboxyvinyltransferase [Armatimonadota bacterium]
MKKIYVTGGLALQGSVRTSGSKNASLALLPAALLGLGETVLENVPHIGDIRTMEQLLNAIGVRVRLLPNGRMHVDASRIETTDAPYDLVKKMRASFCIAGPILARLGRTRVPLPGGCDIGTRAVDFHIKGMEALGAEVRIEHGYVEARANRLRGTNILLDSPSVGATGHILTMACLAEGTTTIQNAAEEPEVVDLANFVNAMGGVVRGAGTSVIEIEGVSSLRGTTHRVIPDRMEAGSFLCAAAATGGDVRVTECIPEHLTALVLKLREAGIECETGPDWIRVIGNGRPRAVSVKTLPYPGFPTDMQQPLTALLTTAVGTSVVTETIYERRFKHVDELRQMGADIKQEGQSVIINGVERLTGARVTASDLRAGAALIIAGLMAHGTTEIAGVEHIERGYEDIAAKFTQLGATIGCFEEGEGAAHARACR